MGADENNLRRSAANFDFDVVAWQVVYLVGIPPRLQSGSEKRTLDEIGSRIQLCVAPHVSLANLAAKRSHIGDQLIA